MFSKIHDGLKQYLSGQLVCPFGKKSIQQGETFFAHRVELAEILKNPNAYMLTEKLHPYVQYVGEGDGMVVSFDTDKKFSFEERTPQKIFHMRKEVYKAMADVASNLTFVLTQYNAPSFKWLRKNSPQPAIGPVHTTGRDVEHTDDWYKKFSAGMQVYDTIGSIPTLQFADERLDTMMFYMGPEYHPDHARYMPQSGIILTKSLAFQSVDQIKGHQTIIQQMLKSMTRNHDKNSQMVVPSAYAGPDYDQAMVDRQNAQHLIREMGCKSREDLTEEAGMRLRNIFLAQQ